MREGRRLHALFGALVVASSLDFLVPLEAGVCPCTCLSPTHRAFTIPSVCASHANINDRADHPDEACISGGGEGACSQPPYVAPYGSASIVDV